MRRLAVLILLAGTTLPALAAKRITVAQLEQVLTSARGKPDAEVAQQISDLELTERLSTETLSQIKAGLPGEKADQNLKIWQTNRRFLTLPRLKLLRSRHPILPSNAESWVLPLAM